MKTRLAVIILLLGTVAFAQESTDALRQRIVTTAYKYKGVPYVYGAMSPTAFDCSGFVSYVYREATGLELPRSSKTYYSVGIIVDPKSAQPGDVFVFDTVGGRPSHVAIYVGDNKVIHAISAGPVTGVTVSSLSERYWAPRIIGVRCFLPQSTSAAAPASAPAQSPPATSIAPVASPPTASAPITAPVAAVSAPTAPVTATPSASTAVPQTPSEASTTAPATTSHSPTKIVRVRKEESIPAGEPIADIGFTIPATKGSFTDTIPTEAGTNVAFTLTNGTGAAGVFMVLFFRIDPKTYKLEKIHEERVDLADKASFSLPICCFEEAGKYKLIVKRSGDQLFERIFEVISSP